VSNGDDPVGNIVNADAPRWSNANMTSNTDEARKSQGYGREIIGMAGQNASSPARTYEQRINQEQGVH
jgi:hypothetical protein